MLSSEGESPIGSDGKKICKGKKRASSNPVPRLIDNKRKHLERQLSASQRDQLLINESVQKIYSRGNSAVQRDFCSVNATDEHVNAAGSPGVYSVS